MEHHYTVQYPYLSIGSTSGIGTFGANISSNDLLLNFFPDSTISGSQEIVVQTYTEVLQTTRDLENVADILTYGPVNEKLTVSGYNALNGDRSNATAFDMKHEGIPILLRLSILINYYS